MSISTATVVKKYAKRLGAVTTVKDYSESRRVKQQATLGFIHSGELRAIDVSSNPGTGRPSWRIPLEAIVEFEERRSAKPVSKPMRRKAKKQTADFVEYF